MSLGTGFVLTALAWIGCGPSPEPRQAAIVAKVGRATLTRQALDQALPEGSGPAERAEYPVRWVEQELLIQAAQADGLERDSVFVASLERARRELLARAAIEQLFRERVPKPTEAEIDSYYVANAASFRLETDQVRFEHLVTDSLGKALSARRAAAAGAPWDSLAARYASVPAFTLADGRCHPLSEVVPGVPEVARFASRLDSGQVSPPVRTALGLHLLRITGRRRAGEQADLSSVRPTIIEVLEMDARQRAYARYLSSLKAKFKVAMADSGRVAE